MVSFRSAASPNSTLRNGPFVCMADGWVSEMTWLGSDWQQGRIFPAINSFYSMDGVRNRASFGEPSAIWTDVSAVLQS